MKNNNITIVLVLKDRVEYTLRFMAYMNLMKCPYKILVADGGKSIEIENILKKYNNFPNVEYEYVRYPYDRTLTEFHQKIFDVVNRINTPLSLLIDNDDFVIFEGLYECEKMLREDEKMSNCRGSLVNFTTAHSGCNGEIIVGEDMYYYPSIVQDTALNRVRQQSKQFHGNWHGVQRTNHLKLTCGLMKESNPTNFRFSEQLVGYLNVICGNAHRGKFDYFLRQANTPRVAGSEDQFPPQEQWIKSEHWLENFNSMADAISVAISKVDNIDFLNAKEQFLSSYIDKLEGLELLKKRIDEVRNMGYNDTRVKRMEEFAQQVEYNRIEKIEEVTKMNCGNERGCIRQFMRSFR